MAESTELMESRRSHEVASGIAEDKNSFEQLSEMVLPCVSSLVERTNSNNAHAAQILLGKGNTAFSDCTFNITNVQGERKVSLSSTINGLTSAHLSHVHTDTIQVVLYSRIADYGIKLQGNVCATKALGSPAVIDFIEPRGKADRCGVLQPGDRILAINGRYTGEMTSDEASRMLKESSQQCVLDIEFDIAETVVPSSGVFNIKLPVGEAGLGLTLTSPRRRHMGEGLMISQVKKGSIAQRSGTMEPGDFLLAIDDIHLDSFSVDEAIHLLEQADDIVKLRVKKDEAYSDGLQTPLIAEVDSVCPLSSRVHDSEDGLQTPLIAEVDSVCPLSSRVHDSEVQDGEMWQRRQEQEASRVQDLAVNTAGPSSNEFRGITIGDNIEGKVEKFDAYVCYCQKDLSFVNKMREKLEGVYNLKLCIDYRDVVPGGCDVSVKAELIKNRCRRMLVILSPEFLKVPKSDVNNFCYKFGVSLEPGAQSRKVIPVIVSPCKVPTIMRHLSKCDYTKKNLRKYFWPKLYKAIISPP